MGGGAARFYHFIILILAFAVIFAFAARFAAACNGEDEFENNSGAWPTQRKLMHAYMIDAPLLQPMLVWPGKYPDGVLYGQGTRGSVMATPGLEYNISHFDETTGRLQGSTPALEIILTSLRMCLNDQDNGTDAFLFRIAREDHVSYDSVLLDIDVTTIGNQLNLDIQLLVLDVDSESGAVQNETEIVSTFTGAGFDQEVFIHRVSGIRTVTNGGTLFLLRVLARKPKSADNSAVVSTPYTVIIRLADPAVVCGDSSKLADGGVDQITPQLIGKFIAYQEVPLTICRPTVVMLPADFMEPNASLTNSLDFTVVPVIEGFNKVELGLGACNGSEPRCGIIPPLYMVGNGAQERLESLNVSGFHTAVLFLRGERKPLLVAFYATRCSPSFGSNVVSWPANRPLIVWNQTSRSSPLLFPEHALCDNKQQSVLFQLTSTAGDLHATWSTSAPPDAALFITATSTAPYKHLGAVQIRVSVELADRTFFTASSLQNGTPNIVALPAAVMLTAQQINVSVFLGGVSYYRGDAPLRPSVRVEMWAEANFNLSSALCSAASEQVNASAMLQITLCAGQRTGIMVKASFETLTASTADAMIRASVIPDQLYIQTSDSNLLADASSEAVRHVWTGTGTFQVPRSTSILAPATLVSLSGVQVGITNRGGLPVSFLFETQGILCPAAESDTANHYPLWTRLKNATSRAEGIPDLIFDSTISPLPFAQSQRSDMVCIGFDDYWRLGTAGADFIEVRILAPSFESTYDESKGDLAHISTIPSFQILSGTGTVLHGPESADTPETICRFGRIASFRVKDHLANLPVVFPVIRAPYNALIRYIAEVSWRQKFASTQGIPVIFFKLPSEPELTTATEIGQAADIASSGTRSAILSAVFGVLAGLVGIIAVALVFVWRRQKHDRRIDLAGSLELLTKRPGADQQTHVTFSKVQRLDGVTLGNIIGEGTLGSVYAADWDLSRVVAKRIDNTEMCTELEVVFQLIHPHILHFFGLARISPALGSNPVEFMVFEFADGNVSTLLASQLADPGSKLSMLVQVARGLQYIHSHAITHHALACSSLVYFRGAEGRLIVKITNFGLSRQGQLHIVSGLPLPVRWSAPEVLSQGESSIQSDMFSFAILAWELFSGGIIPFNKLSDEEAVAVITAGEAESVLGKPEECPDFVFATMSRLWSFTPSSRPTAESVLAVLVEESQSQMNLASSPARWTPAKPEDWNLADYQGLENREESHLADYQSLENLQVADYQLP